MPGNKSFIHKQYLINLYTRLLENGNKFEKILFESALLKLKADVSPKKVENWVVKMEKLWTKML